MTTNARSIYRAAAPALAAAGCLFLNPLLRTAAAQDTRPRIESRIVGPDGMNIVRLPEMLSGFFADANRTVIGVTVAVPGRGDTLGLRVESVTRGGPAEKAGIKEGMRISAINGVNLRIPAADIDDPEMAGVVQRRLQREVAKAKAGDEVELRVSENGQPKTLRIRTVTAGDLSAQTAPRFRLAGSDTARRASLGLSIGNTGSVRDTLGLFITSVIDSGPAAKAGVFEGDRIAAINGVDVRVPREDADDFQASSARMSRFVRELGKAAPGDKVTLKVYANGRYRDVQVTAGRSSDLRSQGFHFNFGDTDMMMSLPRRLETLPKMSAPRRLETLPKPPGRVVLRRGAFSV